MRIGASGDSDRATHTFGVCLRTNKVFPSNRRVGRQQARTLSRRGLMLDVGIIIGSTRPARKAEAVARCVHDISAQRKDAIHKVVAIAALDPSQLDEPMPASMNPSSKPF